MERRKISANISSLENGNDLEEDVDEFVSTRKEPIVSKSTIFFVFVFLCILSYLTKDALFNSNVKPPLPKVQIKQSTSVVEQTKSLTFTPQTIIPIQQTTPYEPVKLETPEELEINAKDMINRIRGMKRSGMVMETDPQAKAAINELQILLRKLCVLKYGPEPYFIEMSLDFPKSMPDFNEKGRDGRVVFQLGPLKYVPYSTYYFLEMVKDWEGGAFHRNAGHVEQAMVTGDKLRGMEGLAFQEYHPSFPHKQFTLGYAGRPGGPEFYISTVDNTDNHGPGSQGSQTEADGCFGVILDKESQSTVLRMRKQPGAGKGSGFVMGNENYIRIPRLTLHHDPPPS